MYQMSRNFLLEFREWTAKNPDMPAPLTWGNTFGTVFGHVISTFNFFAYQSTKTYFDQFFGLGPKTRAHWELKAPSLAMQKRVMVWCQQYLDNLIMSK